MQHTHRDAAAGIAPLRQQSISARIARDKATTLESALAAALVVVPEPPSGTHRDHASLRLAL